jgi:hypothetical protein
MEYGLLDACTKCDGQKSNPCNEFLHRPARYLGVENYEPWTVLTGLWLVLLRVVYGGTSGISSRSICCDAVIGMSLIIC